MAAGSRIRRYSQAGTFCTPFPGYEQSNSLRTRGTSTPSELPGELLMAHPGQPQGKEQDLIDHLRVDLWVPLSLSLDDGDAAVQGSTPTNGLAERCTP